MAFIPKYQIHYTNELLQECKLLFSEQDGEESDIITYAAVNVKLTYDGDEGKFTTLIGSSISAELHLQTDDVDCTLDFINGDKHQWLCEAIIENKTFFKGYVLADEGGWPFQDRPYTVRITAVDGIGLLNDKKIAQGTFSSHHSMIEIAAYCLKQTGLELPIRVIDNVYHLSHTTRDTDINSDMWSQTYFEYRTFQKDATTFTDCYDALEILTKNTHRIHQWYGMWVIARIGTIQYAPFVRYQTDYDANGENPVGSQILEDYATVGKDQLIYPVNENQIKYIKKAVKSSTLQYDYEIWPELPKNNKFERGTYAGTTLALDDSDIDGDGDFTEVIGTANNYTIADWDYGEFDLLDAPAFAMNPGAVVQPKTRKVINDYDLEIIREVSVPASTSNSSAAVSGIKSEAIPVVQGDRIKFSVDKRYAEDLSLGDSGFSGTAIIYVIPSDGGAAWYLINSFTDPQKDGIWTNSFSNGFITASVISVRFGDTDTRRYTSVSVESQPIPVTGDLRVILYNPSGGGGNTTSFFRSFDLEYLPMVAGGFQKVKGDSWTITQQKDFPDDAERKLAISCNPHKVFKGCMLDSAGVPLTPEWKRLGINETKDYKQLANYHALNIEHRRHDMIEGDFKTVMFNPANNQEEYYPIGFHMQYRFTDMTGDTRFMLGAPLEMDLITCIMTCRWYEIYDDNKLAFDGKKEGTEEFKYIF